MLDKGRPPQLHRPNFGYTKDRYTAVFIVILLLLLLSVIAPVVVVVVVKIAYFCLQSWLPAFCNVLFDMNSDEQKISSPQHDYFRWHHEYA